MWKPKWLAKALAWVHRATSDYEPPLPVVMLRDAECITTFSGTGLTTKGEGQVRAAAEKIRRQYGPNAKYHVYAIGNTWPQAVTLTAHTLSRLFGMNHVSQQRLRLVHFLESAAYGRNGTVTVVVTNEPEASMVLELLRQHGPSSVWLPQGVPEFMEVVRAKRNRAVLHPLRLLPVQPVSQDNPA